MNKQYLVVAGKVDDGSAYEVAEAIREVVGSNKYYAPNLYVHFVDYAKAGAISAWDKVRYELSSHPFYQSIGLSWSRHAGACTLDVLLEKSCDVVKYIELEGTVKHTPKKAPTYKNPLPVDTITYDWLKSIAYKDLGAILNSGKHFNGKGLVELTRDNKIDVHAPTKARWASSSIFSDVCGDGTTYKWNKDTGNFEANTGFHLRKSLVKAIANHVTTN